MKKTNWYLKQTRKKAAAAAIFLIIVVLTVSVLFLFIREKQQQEPPLEEVLEEKLLAYETDLRDTMESIKNNEDAARYLLAWAKNRQIPVETDPAGNVIYTIQPEEHITDEKQAVILCSFDGADMEPHIQEIAAALTIAKNTRNNGPFQVIFLAENKGRKTGAQNLNPNLFDENTEMICLGATPSSRVSLITGGYEHLRLTKKLSTTEPSYNKAYKIQIAHAPSGCISGTYDASLNPVKILGGVLAGLKSNSLLFELSGFYGGSEVNYSPEGASMTLIINDSDTVKFENVMNSSIEKTYEKYKEDYPDLEYTCEEINLPSKVISEENTDNLVSLMYTSFNGVYNRNDDGTITALTNIGRISTKNCRLKIDIAVMCSNPSMLQEISETYQTICGLCDVNFTVSEKYPVYDGTDIPASLHLLDTFKEAFANYTGNDKLILEETAVLTNCSFIHSMNPEIPILFCGITEKNKYSVTGAAVTWLDRLQPQEN